VRPWLSQVLRNVVRMRFRGERRRALREEATSEPSTSVGDSLVEAVEAQRLLASQLLMLDEPYRTTVLLRYYQGLSAAEIAARQELPAATVRGRLKEGLSRLRAQLDRERGGRAAWLGGLTLLVASRHASAATTTTGVLIMKGTASAALIAMAVGATFLVVSRRPSSAEGAPSAHSPSTSSLLSSAPARPAPAIEKTPATRVDGKTRTDLLRRIAAARDEARRTTVTTPTAPERDLDADYIHEQIEALSPLVTECYTNALRTNPKLAGTLVVDFSIVGDPGVGGLVGDSKVDAKKSTIADADMSECVQETMYAAKFRPPVFNGTVQVTFPFVFKTGDE
jgi:Sigma-70, region 4